MSDHILPFAPTVRSVIERYISHVVSIGKFCPEALAERQATLAAFVDHMGDVQVANCCADHLAEWIDAHVAWKSMHTKRGKCNQVNAAFNWSASMGRIPKNPFAALNYEEGERRPATSDGVFRSCLRLTDAGFRRFLLFLRDVGCRPGEVRKAEWEEIDWEKEAIVKDKHKTKKKTKRPRVIPLTPVALAIVTWLRARCDGTGPIFRNQRGGGWKKQTIIQKWSRLRAKAGAPKDATMHGVRHQFGTQAVRNGGNLKLISLAMGHASVTTTERYYLHLDGELDAMRREMLKSRK